MTLPCLLLLAAALLVLPLPGLGVGAGHPTPQLAPELATLLAWNLQGHRHLTPLDPTTLADAPDGPAVQGDSSDVEWTASADGSTLVSIEQCPGHCRSTVVVRDGATGAERSRFKMPVTLAYGPFLSPDGERLVLTVPDTFLIWIVLDTASGARVTTISTGDCALFGGGPYRPGYWIGPDGTYLDTLVRACTDETAAAQPAILVRHDLATGAEIDRLALPEVLAGVWLTEDDTTDEQTYHHLTPGPALAPGGRRLAIVHADAAAATLVDLDRFAVERTVTLTHPDDLLDLAFGLLPLGPQGASAKTVPEGTLRTAVFHPDGRHLYLDGFETWRRPSGGEGRRGLGLQLVDLETGTIVAEVALDASYWTVLPAPDGRSVYVVGGTPDEIDQTGTLLHRLDAGTLEPLAERRFADWHEVLLLPIALGGD